jgi:lipopolysaccharide heptosyltransferase I
MSDILFIKTSSLGDVIHHMPALSEARRQRPDARFSWLVEEAFAPLARLHPAVDAVIPVASRRWRRELHRLSTWREFGQFVRALRARSYDEIIDVQGLARTAVMARLARGRRHGYDALSVREPIAARFYDLRYRVDRSDHAIARNRMLTALALGYVPEGPPDYGLDRVKLAAPASAPYGVLLHATARSTKQWREEFWIELGRELTGRGIELVLPWGTQIERARSERIGAAIGGRVPEHQPLDALARQIAGASFVIGVDTGLLHLAAALGVPLVGVFVGSETGLTGPVGSGPITVVGGKGKVPSPGEVMAAFEMIAR